MPDLTTIEQCKHDTSVEDSANAFKEGCLLYGYLEVNRVRIINIHSHIYIDINNCIHKI